MLINLKHNRQADRQTDAIDKAMIPWYTWLGGFKGLVDELTQDHKGRDNTMYDNLRFLHSWRQTDWTVAACYSIGRRQKATSMFGTSIQ